ncbi:MAG TPA: DUF3108 domain-containing protein [Stellaceae bacterium]|nr:DUF3108 domain-containing protein [Stellaceae bacterium]
MLGRRGTGWRGALALPFLLAASPTAVPPVPEAAPLALRYDVYARGLPVLSLDFRLDESAAAYEVSGTVRAQGLLGAVSDFSLHTESRGAIAADKLRPSVHDSASRARRKERRTHLDFRHDGSVVAALTPAEDPDHRLPTAAEVVGTVDPLTAILTIGHVVAKTGSCRAKVPVYDGRRRYDLVLADDGMERPAPSERGKSADLRRCALDMVKLAGFTADRNRPPRTEHGKVWIMPPPRAGMPPLPARIEFHSDWGPITVQMAPIGVAK